MDTITVTRGDTLSVTLADLPLLTGQNNLWFTVKKWLTDADANAILQIDSDTGLLLLNGVAVTGSVAEGSITIDDYGTGSVAGADITIELSADITEELDPGTYVYDVQLLEIDGTVTTVGIGKLVVESDVTLSR